MSPDPLGGTCCFRRLQPRRLGGSMYISSDARSSHRMAFTQRQQDTGCHGDSSPDPPRPQKPKQAPSLVAPTGLPADNHITRHPSCWRVGPVGRDVGPAPGRGAGHPDEPVRAPCGLGLPRRTPVSRDLALPTSATQGESLRIRLRFLTCKTRRTTPVPPT